MNNIKYFKPEVTIFKITGIDSQRYLQGRITQDIKQVSAEKAIWSFILSPQGKIEGCFYIFKKDDFYILVLDKLSKEGADLFISSLFRFKVADQVFAEDITDNYKLVSFLNLPQDLISQEQRANTFLYEVSRGSMLCHDFLIESKEFIEDSLILEELSKIIKNNITLSSMTDQEYDVLRISSGYPVFNKDITSDIFAPDMPLSWYVSFNKGCYAGQEVVEMATARGKPNRLFVKVKGEADLSDNSSYLLFSSKSKENPNEFKKAGFITSFAMNEDGKSFEGIGFLKNAYSDQELKKYAGMDEEKVFPVTIENVS